MPSFVASLQVHCLLNDHLRSWTMQMRRAFTSCLFAFLSINAQADVAVPIEIKPSNVAAIPDAQAKISGALTPAQPILAVEPKEIGSITNAIKTCSSHISGWNKSKFLQDFFQEEAKINETATLIAKRSAVFLSGSHPLVNESAFPSVGGTGLELPDKVKRFLEDAETKGIDIAVLEVHGIPGNPISDAEALKDKGLVTKEDIGFAVASYFSEAFPRLYSWLSETPSECYSAEQQRFLKERLKDTFKPESGIRAHYPAAQLIEIECGNGKTYSRFKIPANELRPVVANALKVGPWPFGPAGMYFTRSWFLRNAVWQMYGRESHEFRDNLTVDVADYSCGPP
jgi:hypothetical protein